jgi:intracellular sulfur oxidation DsrE/DsrF family protein
MKYYFSLLLSFLLLCFSFGANAQHKIIWEIASSDTAQQRILYNQVNNVLNEAPDTKIELVFHGTSVFAMLKDTGYHKALFMPLYKKGVILAVCNNSLKKRNIAADRVIPEAIIVPVAILEIVKKQEAGWSYIKSGN